jgi:hypothetical protein
MRSRPYSSDMIKQIVDKPVETVQKNGIEPEKIVRSIDEQYQTEGKVMKKIVAGVYILLIVFGIGTGYLLSKSTVSGTKSSNTSATTTTPNGKIVGINDTQTFKDSAEGTLKKGGMDGEGTHQLIRDGGPSQTVYLISSAVDLDQYVGKKVKVWGQTQAAQKVAWLMDVGKIQVSE